MVERLDKVNASFVSFTQSFNTATSMGQLTLNVLLSFAQFEREVTSEQIRDKIAASTRLNKLVASLSTDEIGVLAFSVDALDPKMDQVNILKCVHKANLAPYNMHVELRFEATIELLGVVSDGLIKRLETTLAESNSLTFVVPFQHRKQVVETKLIIGEPQGEQDKTLIQNLAMAYYYLNEIKSGKHIDEIATSSNTSKRRIMQIIDLAFLAPDVVKSIFQGKQPCSLTTKFLQRHPLPANWQKQLQIIQAL